MRKRTCDWWDAFFIELVRVDGNIRAAAARVYKHHTTVYRALNDREHPDFRCQFERVMLTIRERRYKHAEYRRQAA